MSSVKVAVRVRPFNEREKERNAELIVDMNGNSTVLTRPSALRVNPTAPPTAEDEKSFTFDHSYWSFNQSDPHFASQATVYNDLGKEVLKNAWEGFNCSIFAYGQTGSGKSYSMLGYNEDKGIIPLVCEEMFERINATPASSTEQTVFKVEVSFMEIYNEKVKDLLNPKNNKPGGLKVRNNPSTGPYVEDLSKLAVKSFAEIDMLMDEGTKARTVASTNMNATSSRSHAVFTIVFTQSKIDRSRGTAIDRVSKISLVDLAGSERANSTGATGVRLKEGANINKSLSTLGKVISALAENSTGKKAVFVPYRDSVLTYLLKESLGGNSKTIMIAAISPADINFEETLSTLRYADSAKKIKTVAVVNEDPQSKLIRELQNEVERLKQLMLNGGTAISHDSKLINSEYDDGLVSTLTDKIEQYEKLMAELNKSWEEKLSEAETIREDRMAALKDMGIAIKVVSSIPHLINLNEDPLMSESLIYYVKEGLTRIGRSDAEIPQNVILNGLNIHKEHCILENKNGIVTISPPPQYSSDNATNSNNNSDKEIKSPASDSSVSSTTSEKPPRSYIYVNGAEISKPTVLTTGNRVILGNNHIFRYNNPEEAAKIAKERQGDIKSDRIGVENADQIIDYDFALNELASIQGTLAMTKHISDKQEYKKQMRALYDQIRLQLENEEFDPEIKEKRDKLALLAIRKWRSKVHRTKLLNKISFIILSLNEANAISATLNKHISLSLKLYSVFPDSDSISDNAEPEIDWRNTQILIKAINTNTGESTLMTDQDFVDRIYAMRELYQNDGNLDNDQLEDPYHFTFTKDSLIGVSHVYLKNTPYLVESNRPVPILDANGKEKGYLNLLVSSSSTDITDEERGQYLEDPIENKTLLYGKNLEITVGFEGFKDFIEENRYDDVFIKFSFPNENGTLDTYTTDPQSAISFIDEKKIVIKSLNEELVHHLQTQYVSLEIRGTKKLKNNISSATNDQLMKPTPMFENFEFLATLNILESEKNSTNDDDFKPVHILEDPDVYHSHLPSVTFRLKKDKVNRQILFKVIKNESKCIIKECKAARITDVKVFGKRDNTSGFVATPNTPSTPNNSRAGTMTPSTPMTPYGGSNPQQQGTPYNPTSNPASTNSLLSTPNSGVQSNLLKDLSMASTSSTTSNAISNPSSSSNSISNSASNSSLSLLSTQQPTIIGAVNGGNLKTIELPVISITSDSVLLSWKTNDPSYLLNHKTRKGDKILFKLGFDLVIDGFPDIVTISKDIAIKIISSDSMVTVPDGSNTSMSNLLDKFKTHFKGETIISEPTIHAGSVFNVNLTKSRQLEHQNRIGEMIDAHQENILKLGYAMKMEKLRQELDLREKLTNLKEKTLDSSNVSLNESTEQNTSTIDVEEIIKKMLLMNSSHQHFNEANGTTVSSSPKINKSTSTPSSNRKRSSTIVEVKVKEVPSSALLKEDETSGYLKKKSAFKEEWKPRWFVFKKPFLYYSHSQKDTHKLKKIDLTNSSVTAIPQEEVPFGFAIIQLRRVWLLQASSNEEREKWVSTLDPLKKVTELKDEELRTAKQQIEKSSSQLDQIKSQLQSGQQIVLAKQKEIEELTNTISQLQLEREVNNQQFDGLKDEITMRDEEIQQYKSQQTQKLSELSGQVNQLEIDSQDKDIQIGSLSSTLDNTNQIISLMSEQTKSYRNVAGMEIDSLRTETTQLRETTLLLTNRLKDCRTTIQNAEKDILSKDIEIQELKLKISQSEEKNNIDSLNLKNLQEDTSMKQGQIDVLSKSIQQSRQAIQNINQVNEKEIQNKDQQIDNINSAYKSESDKLKDQTSQLNHLTSNLRVQMKSLESTHQNLKETSATDQKTLLLLLHDMEGGLTKASQTINDQGEQILLLKKDLEESKKQSEQIILYEKQLTMMKDRLIQSENQLIDRECDNTILSDKLKLWEEEIKIKDAKLNLLENNVKEVRAEYANGMAFSREFSNHHQEHSSSSNSKFNRRSKQMTAEEQIETMRESSIAHQTHNAFLNLQIQRLESEMRTQEKVYSETIQRIKRDLQQRNQQNIVLMKQQAGDEVVKKLEDTTANLESVKNKYFVSLVVAAKLQNSMMGNYCNVDAYELLSKAMEQHILNTEDWPNFVSAQINEQSHQLN
ncbi:hypothetical protein DICPUDRAFT_93725 [Dictyostelium purpureum]|uniref:Kinesin-3 n=1 Tax=Dictyostelium purpureum TaxID=5786 RepID=F0ZAX7_DICPU|nr:uncharacterized protein DICPUDRAFT_93725 [Dictyostelium purpureum]EGC38876.1 hypothetical protein DICPUDRAFT_93725 [Dictyostelium purpureum]|eukprot:XP_003284556.1 hypothetical protein DICPUDRAFT_93725 [Dictyostelium purpureum]